MSLNFTKTLALGALGALAGCGGSVEGPTSQAPVGEKTPVVEEPAATEQGASEAVANIDKNLERLRSLEVVGVGELIVKLPEEATNCYGPCPGFEDVIADAEKDAAERLQSLATVAEAAVKTPAQDACAAASIDANLAALRGLEVVEVEGLLKAEPKNNPNCYNLPCQEDIDAAQAITCERAGKLASIADAAKGL
jgi:hypothetical protein